MGLIMGLGNNIRFNVGKILIWQNMINMQLFNKVDISIIIFWYWLLDLVGSGIEVGWVGTEDRTDE